MSAKLFRIDPFDRYMLVVIAVIVLATALVVLNGDHVGVNIVEVEPVDHAHTGTNVEIKITFDQLMDQDSVREHFSIEPNVEGTFRWRNTTMTFTPREPLHPGGTYTIDLKDGAKSVTGRNLQADYRWSFSTRPAIAMAYYLSPANVAERSLWAVSLDDPTPRQVFASQFGVYDFEPSPNNAQIAITLYGGDSATTNLWLIDADGSNPRQILDCSPGVCGRPAWSPDGKLIAYERQIPTDLGALAPSRIWLLDTETGATAPVYEDSQVLGYQAIWSPVGRVLSFYDSNITAIRIIDLENRATQSIETQLSERWSFSADGKSLSYSDLRLEDRFYYAELWSVELWNPDAERHPLLEVQQEDQEPVWSPDGQWMAFRRREIDGATNGWQIMLYNATTGEIQQLTNDADYTSRLMRWNATSQMVVFQRYSLLPPNQTDPPRPLAEIWLYDMTTQEVRVLAVDAFNPYWVIL